MSGINVTPAVAAATPPRVVVMGVSGSGKTTIGALVARGLGVPFLDGDSLHPMENIAKMAAGTPLTDDDRWPWLATVGSELAAAGNDGLVLACSALRRSYRDAIRAQAPDTVFLHLNGDNEVLGSRLEGRSGHFMPAALLESQLATLEPLQTDEAGIAVNIAAPVDQVVAEALAGIGSRPASPNQSCFPSLRALRGDLPDISRGEDEIVPHPSHRYPRKHPDDLSPRTVADEMAYRLS